MCLQKNGRRFVTAMEKWAKWNATNLVRNTLEQWNTSVFWALLFFDLWPLHHCPCWCPLSKQTHRLLLNKHHSSGRLLVNKHQLEKSSETKQRPKIFNLQIKTSWNVHSMQSQRKYWNENLNRSFAGVSCDDSLSRIYRETVCHGLKCVTIRGMKCILWSDTNSPIDGGRQTWAPKTCLNV